MKEQFRETDVIRNITEIQFGVLSPNDMQQLSHIQVSKDGLYMKTNAKIPTPEGVLDSRLGVSQSDKVCGTCSKTIVDCVGHFGHMDLPQPVFHVGYFKNIVHLLQNICKVCSHVLLKPSDKKMLLSTYKKTTSYLKKKAQYKKINELCKKINKCPYCGARNGVVKKFPPLKIIHEKFRNVKKGDPVIGKYKDLFTLAFKNNKELEPLLPATPFEYLQPSDVLRLFTNIPLEDLPLLCMDEKHSHPKDLILTRILVPPNVIRPSITSDLKAGTNEDDITSMLNEIAFLSGIMNKRVGSTTENYMEPWEHIQLSTAFLINSEINVPADWVLLRKNARGFVQRLKGKQGRFRGNLSGKRVDFSSRTVISPDPNLRINEVGVPIEVAMQLTYPERVTPHNIKLLRQLVKNGPDVYPGAIYMNPRNMPGLKKALKFIHRTHAASELKNGDIIERHLLDGDIVLFNRQPSLHKMSIMCHQVRVLPGRTFRFNECVCTPYNADFDGDEMNLHVPQTEEARAEAMVLMGVKSNLVTPRNGDLIIGATQDFLTGAYLLTQKDQFFDKEHTMMLISSILEGKEASIRIDLPPPAIVKPVQLWTGKQIFSTVIRPCKNDECYYNLVVKRKDYTKGEELCSNEAFVIFRNSELLAGALDKSILGSGSKKNLFYIIYKDYGEDRAADAMWRVARLTISFLLIKGFSIGIGDVMPGKGLLNRKQELLDEGYRMCNTYIEQLKEGTLNCQPGCTAEESLEQLILKELSNIREKAGKACLMELHKSNVALIMALSGSKGSFINISQMIACVGQQAIGGKRVPNGFDSRALPHFKKFSKEPAAKGFVSNSFFTGITPTEFIFHTMAGREGLVDTAVKTSETGYMQRRLVKSLEDLHVGYDMTVRNSSQDIIQFRYGEDGLDPSKIESKEKIKEKEKDRLIDFERVLNHVRAKCLHMKDERISGSEALDVTKKYLTEDIFKSVSENFKKEIEKFISEFGCKIDKERECIPADMAKEYKFNVYKHIGRLTFTQLVEFLNMCLERYQNSIMEPGTAVGALCAQSIGEPGTQMTLKTFHFAGVASMNITLGVPRILEIINASQSISTPIITARLKCKTDPEKARQVKGRIEKTKLGEICEYVEEIYKSDDCMLIVKLSMERIKLLKLEVDIGTIKYAICTSKYKIKESDVSIQSDTVLAIRPSQTKNSSILYQLQYLKQHITEVVVKGLPTVNRAVIHQIDSHGKLEYELLVEGDNFRDVIATPGVDGIHCTSNNTYEVFITLGLEAARTTIMTEIYNTMESHGLYVNTRHIMLLSDLMTNKGQVLGITRHGLSKMRESVLMLASFEKTSDHLFDAAYHGQSNPIVGVSDCIIMGKPMNIGTGVFKLLHKHKKVAKPNTLGLIFDHPEYHISLEQSGWV
ncbi:DNA-directed RNA polymerase III subunit RPC1 [Armadillidium nasatum]|uniref:DNA-directed RNA polymerase subunit n=1 Tax=Armadillidium nasatum TaxID=96803 RepID=A0A5N5SP72_9CRUS|nr:DNA-directed RNA polymerase III subunit RPC1 [Armadillidium nasatum]